MSKLSEYSKNGSKLSTWKAVANGTATWRSLAATDDLYLIYVRGIFLAIAEVIELAGVRNLSKSWWVRKKLVRNKN